jgi:predicted nucleic acid-binding protein
VRLFFDTSVLVPAFITEHVHHAASKAAYQQGRREDRSCGGHSLAEFYSAFTGVPRKFRLDGSEILLMVGDILENLSIVTLAPDEYVSTIQDAVRGQIVGATIYDALLARCAMKAEADVIYTWNLKHFQQFPDIRSRVRTPRAFST